MEKQKEFEAIAIENILRDSFNGRIYVFVQKHSVICYQNHWPIDG